MLKLNNSFVNKFLVSLAFIFIYFGFITPTFLATPVYAGSYNLYFTRPVAPVPTNVPDDVLAQISGKMVLTLGNN